MKNQTIFITGADGGIGSALVKECVNRGASKVYAAGLNMGVLTDINKEYKDVVYPIQLDITDENQIKKISDDCTDTDILINNAGVERKCNFTSSNSFKESKFEMSVNFHGTHNLCQSFIPILENKENPKILNILSLASVMLVPGILTYCASKAACHFLTVSLREELKNTNISIAGAYPGYIDTKMVEDIVADKVSPKYAAEKMLEQLINGEQNIFPDPMSQRYRPLLNLDPPILKV